MLRRVGMMAALAALLAPVGMAEAATKSKKKLYPKITSVSPKNAEVGDTLTIKGKNFRRGRGKNTVVFKRDGGRAVFIKADIGTTKQIQVKLTPALLPQMTNAGAARLPTKFRLRILAQRFGKKFTADGLSPKIGPDNPPPPPAPPGLAAADGDCDADGILNGKEADDDADGLNDDVELSLLLDPCKVDTDADGLLDTWEYDCDRDKVLNRDESDDDDDLLSDAAEAGYMTDPCSKDTDGDGVEDAYEIKSAIDLNSTYHDGYLPYPGKKPYPNPLFKDAELDYDGDGLWLADEHALWQKFGVRNIDTALIYSDGRQHSRDIAAVGYDKQAQFRADAGIPVAELLDFDGIVVPGVSGLNGDHDSLYGPGGYAPDGAVSSYEDQYYDRDLNGRLSDDELDEDADGLGNWEETHGPMNPAWWTAIHTKENEYVIPYAGTTIVDRDSDGDGVIDGADDNDHDGVPNVQEVSRQLVAGEVPNNFGGSGYVRWSVGDGNGDIQLNRWNEGAPDADPWDWRPARAWVQPFNPCLPDAHSATCERHPNLEALYPPFDAEAPRFNVFDGFHPILGPITPE